MLELYIKKIIQSDSCMNIQAVKLLLKELILHSSATVRSAITAFIIIAVCMLWYFVCYAPCGSYINAYKGSIEQQKRKKASLEKRLAHAAETRDDLALIERKVREARALLPPVWESQDSTLRKLFEKHELEMVSQKEVSRKHVDRYRIGIVQHECELRVAYEQIVELFNDLAATVLAPHCENLIIKRTASGVICTCIFVGLEMGDA